jgi:hypothetical protein
MGNFLVWKMHLEIINLYALRQPIEKILGGIILITIGVIEE